MCFGLALDFFFAKYDDFFFNFRQKKVFKTGDNGIEDFAINLWNALYPNVNLSLNPVASLERQKFLEMAKILLVQVH